MDRLTTGEKIAAASGVALLLIMFILDWFSVSAAGGIGPSFGGNAWDTMELIRWILLLTALAGIGLAVVKMMGSDVDVPLSSIAAGLGLLSVVFVAFRILSPPDGGLGDLIDVGRDIGVFLGLIAAAGVAYGGYQAMQEEGTSYGNTAAPPPPPPPPPAPPAA